MSGRNQKTTDPTSNAVSPSGINQDVILKFMNASSYERNIVIDQAIDVQRLTESELRSKFTEENRILDESIHKHQQAIAEAHSVIARAQNAIDGLMNQKEGLSNTFDDDINEVNRRANQIQNFRALFDTH